MGREKVTSTLVVSGLKIEYKADKEKGVIYTYLSKEEKGKGRPKADNVLTAVKGQAASKTVHNFYTAKLAGELPTVASRQPLKPGERAKVELSEADLLALEDEKERVREERENYKYNLKEWYRKLHNHLLDIMTLYHIGGGDLWQGKENGHIPAYEGGAVAWTVSGGCLSSCMRQGYHVKGGAVYEHVWKKNKVLLGGRIIQDWLTREDVFISSIEEWARAFWVDCVVPELIRLRGLIRELVKQIVTACNALGRDTKGLSDTVNRLGIEGAYHFYTIFKVQGVANWLGVGEWQAAGSPFWGKVEYKEASTPQSKQRRFYADYCKFIGKTNNGETLPTFEEWQAAGSPTATSAGYKFDYKKLSSGREYYAQQEKTQ